MKIAVIVVRVLMGLMFLFASVLYFYPMFPVPEATGNMKVFGDGLVASGYLLQVVKTIELVCALLLLAGRFLPLVTVVLFPIIVNIVMVHTFLDQKTLPVALLLLAGDLFLAWNFRESYRPLFKAK